MPRQGNYTGKNGSGGRVPILGLTGNIGSGKSTVANLLEARGAAVIDADELSRQATADRSVLQRIAEEFGPELITDGALDRGRLAEQVFGDRDALRSLEGIIHPWVRARSRELQDRLLSSPRPPAVIVHDSPLLFEKGLEGDFDAVIVVAAAKELRAARTAARSNLSRDEFEARDAAQWRQRRKEALADYVIDNDGDLSELESKVDELWSRLLTS